MTDRRIVKTVLVLGVWVPLCFILPEFTLQCAAVIGAAYVGYWGASK